MTARHSSKVSSGTARIKHRTRKEQSRCNTDGQVMFVYFPVVTRYGTPPKVLKISVFTYQSSSLGFETGPGSFRLIHICFTSAAGPQILNKQCCLIAFTFLRTFTSHPLPLPLLNSFDTSSPNRTLDILCETSTLHFRQPLLLRLLLRILPSHLY